MSNRYGICGNYSPAEWRNMSEAEREAARIKHRDSQPVSKLYSPAQIINGVHHEELREREQRRTEQSEPKVSEPAHVTLAQRERAAYLDSVKKMFRKL